MTSTLLSLVAISAAHAAPWGYELDCGNCPIGGATLVIHLAAADGTEFTTGKITLAANPTPAGTQAILFGAIEDSGFVVTLNGPGKVVVFGPHGRTVKSVKFEADTWTPVVRRVVATPPKK